MTDGYSHGPEVENVLAAAMAFGGPGQVLFGIAQNARDAFRELDYANRVRAADALAGHLEVALGLWTAETRSYLKKGEKTWQHQ